MDIIPNQSRQSSIQHNGDGERSPSEQALHGSAIPFTTILEQMPDAVLVLDTLWRITYLNPQAEPCLQKSRAELLGRNIWEAFPHVLDTPLFNYCQQARTTGKAVSCEYLSPLVKTWFHVHISPSAEGVCVFFQDITERKRAEESIQQSELRFRAMFNQWFAFLGVLTPAGLLIDVNDLVLTVTGFQRGQLIGLPFWETGWWYSLPHEASRVKEAVFQAAIGQTVQFESAYLTSDGKKRIVAALIKPLLNEIGEVEYVIAEGSDITERKHAEERLRQSEQHFRALIEHNADGIALTDAHGNINYVSPSTTRMVGLLPEELVGHRILQRLVYPEDREAASHLLARVFEEPGKSQMLEYRARHKNGSLLWMEIVGINLLHEPGVEAIVWNFRDVTERKQLTEEVAKAKEQLEAILSNVADGILVVDASGKVVYVNDIGANVFGYPSAAAMLAAQWCALDQVFSRLPSWDEQGNRLSVEERPTIQALQGKKAQALFQYQDTVTGQMPWLLVKSQPIFDTQGQVQFVVSVSTDMTEQKEFERQKDEFILNVSHELRTPLTAVVGYLELLRDHQARLKPLTQAQFIARTLENCQELMRLTNSVLDALHASNVKHPALLEKLAVCEIVYELLAQFDPDTKQAHTLTVEIPEEVTVWADKQYLQQVLRNLLANAFKYAPKQTPILLSASDRQASSLTAAPVPEVCICVQDAGPGIPLAEQSLLFHKFKRLNRDLSSTVRGTGLGLYICKQLVEMMEGHIWIESSGRAGEGSRFCFTLPEAGLPLTFTI